MQVFGVILNTILILMFIFIVSCEDLSADELSKAKKKWYSNEALNYSYTAEWKCWCPHAGIVRIVVRDGEVVSRSSERGVSLEKNKFIATIPGHFWFIEKVIEVENSYLHVKYDKNNGIPVFIEYYDKSTTDTGLYIKIIQFDFEAKSAVERPR